MSVPRWRSRWRRSVLEGIRERQDNSSNIDGRGEQEGVRKWRKLGEEI